MARHDKTKGASLLMQDKFFYTLLTVTLVLLIAAFYFAFGTGEVQDAENPENSGVTDVEGTLSEADTETVKGDIPSDVSDTPEAETQVQAPVENLPDDTEKIPDSGTVTDEPELPKKETLSFIIPCDGSVIKDFSGSTPVFSETLQDWRTHSGIDYSTKDHANVFAAADGVVDDVYTDELMGVSILIKHDDGVYTLYQGLMENTKVLQRMEVKQGDVIGKTGITAIEEETEGCHLHFELIIDGKQVDPNEYLS